MQANVAYYESTIANYPDTPKGYREKGEPHHPQAAYRHPIVKKTPTQAEESDSVVGGVDRVVHKTRQEDEQSGAEPKMNQIEDLATVVYRCEEGHECHPTEMYRHAGRDDPVVMSYKRRIMNHIDRVEEYGRSKPNRNEDQTPGWRLRHPVILNHGGS